MPIQPLSQLVQASACEENNVAVLPFLLALLRLQLLEERIHDHLAFFVFEPVQDSREYLANIQAHVRYGVIRHRERYLDELSQWRAPVIRVLCFVLPLSRAHAVRKDDLNHFEAKQPLLEIIVVSALAHLRDHQLVHPFRADILAVTAHAAAAKAQAFRGSPSHSIDLVLHEPHAQVGNFGPRFELRRATEQGRDNLHRGLPHSPLLAVSKFGQSRQEALDMVLG
mmetsp:Transcript_12074/g.34960  ORF Transcript_12074/g.34960 Transcript_12074/m.34960 type:complete len:225 (-) Transcript_12074:1334-2008(-)